MKKRENKSYPDISVVLPCRNEELALPVCLTKIIEIIDKNNLDAEIIVSDSSTDNSRKIAQNFIENNENIILIKHTKVGYGNAYLETFKHIKGKYIFMADSDGSYDFNEIPRFIKELEQGNDLVIGNRFSGKIEKNAMPFANRFLGNPILSSTLRLLFSTSIRDSQSGMRAIKKTTLDKLNLKTTGMEFASEMIIKAIKNNLRIKELPIDYHKRIGISKLNPFSDGWKHFRFMLLYSPIFLFLIPGIILFFLGLNLMILPYLTSIKTSLISSFLTIIGYQLIFFSIFAKTYQITKLDEESMTFNELYKYITIERGSLFALISIFLGIFTYFFLNHIIAFTIITLAIQTIFYSFMLSILGIKER